MTEQLPAETSELLEQFKHRRHDDIELGSLLNKIFLTDKTGMGTSSSAENATRNLRRICWCCAMGAFLVGYATSSINGAILFIIREMQLDPVGIGLLSSCFEVGAGAGSLLSGIVADKLGRKRILLCADVLYLIAIGATVLAPNLTLLVLARALLGLAVGAINVIAPVLLAEFCTPDVRARRLTTSSLLYAGGESCVFIVGALLGNVWFDNASIWRWIYVLAFIPAVPLLILHAIIVPESPKWLAKKGRIDQTMDILCRIRRNSAEIGTEIRELSNVTNEEATDKTLCYLLKTPWIRSVLLLGIGIAMIQQSTGVSIGMKFGTFMLNSAGLSPRIALALNTTIGLVTLGAVSVGLFLVSRVPLRRLLMGAQLGIICAHLSIALASALLAPTMARGWIVLGLLLVFMVFVQGSVSPVSGLMMNEIFPLHMRGLGKGASILAVYATACVLDQLFPIFHNFIGQSATFGLFALIGCCALLFSWHFLPETQGKSLEELEQQFRSSDWKALKRLGESREKDGECRGVIIGH